MSGFPTDCYFYLESLGTDLVLDVYNGAVKEDAILIIWTMKTQDNENQLWRSEDGFLINKKSNLVIDVRGGELKSDTPLVQYNRKMTMAHNQRWGFRNGFVYVLADPTLVLDVKGGKKKDGKKVILYERKEDDNVNQQWRIVPCGDYHHKTPQEALAAYSMPPQYAQQQPYGQQNPYPPQNSSYGGAPGYGIPDNQSPRVPYGQQSNVLPYEQAQEAHKQVYEERKAHLSHQVIAGAAGYEAVKAYISHQESQGKPVNHQFAKKAIAGLVAAQMLKFAEEHDWSGSDKEKATREAELAADNYFTREINSRQ
ncbi:ricin B lectin domain-containing protein [Phycomyces nitens]|nr:ricin B lectin domain-containing protein [Phycomyces nitens]